MNSRLLPCWAILVTPYHGIIGFIPDALCQTKELDGWIQTMQHMVTRGIRQQDRGRTIVALPGWRDDGPAQRT